MKPRVLLVALLCGLLAGCTAAVPDAAPAPARTTDLAAALATLPTDTLQPTPTMRLAPHLLPPTNRWFSGLVFGPTPQPVFPLPLAYSPTATGFSISLPTVTASADTIAGPAGDGLGLDLHATGFDVTRYDALSVTATYRKARSALAAVTLAEGWPYVAVTARAPLAATLTAPVVAAAPGLWRAEVAGVRYDLTAPAGSVHGDVLRLPTGKRAVLFAVPPTARESALVTGAKGAVLGTTVEAGLTARTATTRLRYRTTGGAPTALAAWPGSTRNCSAGSVLTIYGTMPLCPGTTLSTSAPRLAPTDRLDMRALSAAERARIRAALHADLAATPTQPADTYGGGKWLYRLANLLQLALQLDATADAARARGLLDDALQQWTEPSGCARREQHCFVYDPVLHGVVGHAASFGTDQFNDHHFHYGYFLYAAAVAVTDRPALATAIAPGIDLLAADIANPTPTTRFPAQRTFDPYAGHSWASGFAPFRDGNDEESSSEAVNAWNGLALWARASKNPALEREAEWLLAREAHAALTQWVTPDVTAFPGYRHHLVALNWGGKRDSATWFSPDPGAKLAIQLIPMSPAAGYLATGVSSVRANLAEARGSRLFPDYRLMYEALAGGSVAPLLARLAALPASAIDSADSRAYAMAWIATH